jgi:uncharacterized protein with ATP-grasp and redox domains
MNSREECITCLLNFCERTLNHCEMDEGDRQKLLDEIAAKLENISLKLSPAAIADYATGIIRERVGIEDLYKGDKSEQNTKALAVYPQLKEMVDQAKDRLKTAFLIAATGNIIDLGAHADFNVEGILRDFSTISFAKDDFEVFRDQLNRSKTLLFIADNCGEIIFDRVMLEELRDIRKIVAVKTIPFINDVTIGDVYGTGIEDTAEIIETGTCNLDFSCPTINVDFLALFKSADVVISKGHANFEALHGKRKDVFFLLRAKCDVVAAVIGVDKGDFIFSRIPE